MGANVGAEADGKGEEFLRPVFIYRKINKETFFGIPITSKLRDDTSHVAFYFKYNLHTAVLSQSKTFDKRRLVSRMGEVSDYLFLKIRKRAIIFLW